MLVERQPRMAQKPHERRCPIQVLKRTEAAGTGQGP